MLCGLAVIYGCGVIWLAYFARARGISIGLQAALAAGVYPFVIPDLLKVLVAAGVLPGLWHLIGRTDVR
jgi:biotin transporter BioY